MPFQSEKQRKYLWANEPAIAKRWEKYPKGYNTGGVSHLFRSKEDRTGFNKGTEKKDGTGLIIWGKSVADQWPNLNESQKDYIRKHWPQHVPKGHAQGGYIRPEEDGVLGLADGGRIGFNAGSMLVAPTTDGSRPGYAYDDVEDMGFGDGADMGSEMGVEDMSGVGENSGDDGGVPDYESGSPENTWATMSPEMAEKSKAETERVLGDHGDPMGSPDEQAKYARYVKYTAENQPLNKTEDLTFKEHWDNAPGILKYSLVLRGLYAAGKNLAEWARSKGWNWNSTTGKVTDNDGNEVSESDMQGATASQAPYMVSGTTPVNSMATQWYSTLGSSPSNPGAFDLTAQYAKAKAAVSQRLGNPTSVGQLAVNNSPFYNWLKDNSLNKGIL